MKRLGMAVIALGIILFSTCLFAQTNVIRNGTFANGMQDWNLDPAAAKASPGWIPVAGDGKLSLDPPDAYDFGGPVVRQNLNVTGIGGKTFNLSMMVFNGYSYTNGNTLGIYLAYVNSSNEVTPVKITIPANQSITSTGTTVTASHTFPSDARKLIALVIAKEDWCSGFQVDDITLTAEGVAAGSIPAITSISPASGPYGTQVVITGTNFGTTSGGILAGGKMNGVTVTNWTDTQITATVQEPCEGGKIQVVSDYTLSDLTDKGFEITSPYFTVDVVSGPMGNMPKGQIAEYALKVDFKNGFTATDIAFSVAESNLAPAAQFLPVPVTRSGGLVLKINTSSLGAGTYPITVQAVQSGHPAHTAAASLGVFEAASIDLYQYDASWHPDYLTSSTIVTKQGQPIYYEITGSDNSSAYGFPVTLISSDPAKLLVYQEAAYPQENGTVTLTAGIPGTTVTKQVTFQINIPSTLSDPLITGLSLNPATITNTYTDPISFHAGYQYSGSVARHYGYSSSFIQLNLLNDTRTWTDDYTVDGTFKVDQSTSDVGTYLFEASICPPEDSSCSLYNAAASRIFPFTITNDPGYSAGKGTVYSIDPALQMFQFEHFVIELYSGPGTKAYSKELMSQGSAKTFDAYAVPPGTYRVRIVPPEGMNTFEPQWYPNAADYNGAASVTFTAGQSANDLCFFLRAPQTNTYSISGQVTSGGSGLAGVTITLSGVSTGSATTDSNGNYTLSGLPDGNYVLTPSMTGLTFDPATRSVTVSGANVTGQNFTVATATYSVSGAVTFNGSPLSGVTMTLGGAGTGTTTSATDGSYTFSGLANGAYTLTPSKSGYAFTPASRSITLVATVISEDFTAAQVPVYAISGLVRDLATQQSLSGVTVTAKNATTSATVATTTTEATGHFSVILPGPGQYFVVAAKSGYEESSPPAQPIDVTDASPTHTADTIYLSPALGIQLNQGWNFISLPVQPANPAATAVFAGVIDNVLIVWGWDNQQQRWLSFIPGVTQSFTMESGKGYWIFMDQPAYLGLAGNPGPTTIPLYEGWNLVGYNGTSSTPRATALSSIADKWSIIWGWENGNWSAAHATITNLPVPVLDSLSSYEAYWINVKPGRSGNWAQ